MNEKNILPDVWARLGSTVGNVVHELCEHMEVDLAMFCKPVVNEIVGIERLELGRDFGCGRTE